MSAGGTTTGGQTVEPIAILAETEQAIAELLTHYPLAEAALLPVLHKVQDELGWLPLAAMDWVAERLALPRTRVYSVASFYTMFLREPPGRHRLEICTNLSCSLMGAEHLRNHLCQRLGIKPGQTTPDGEITLTEVECLGSCGTAPVMIVDDEYHESLTPDKIDALLDGLKGAR